MNCEEYVIELCNRKDSQIDEMSRTLEEMGKRLDTLQDAVNFIAKGVSLKKSNENEYYVSIASAWEKYEPEAFTRYCSYFGLQKPEEVVIEEVDKTEDVATEEVSEN